MARKARVSETNSEMVENGATEQPSTAPAPAVVGNFSASGVIFDLFPAPAVAPRKGGGGRKSVYGLEVIPVGGMKLFGGIALETMHKVAREFVRRAKTADPSGATKVHGGKVIPVRVQTCDLVAAELTAEQKSSLQDSVLMGLFPSAKSREEALASAIVGVWRTA